MRAWPGSDSMRHAGSAWLKRARPGESVSDSDQAHRLALLKAAHPGRPGSDSDQARGVAIRGPALSLESAGSTCRTPVRSQHSSSSPSPLPLAWPRLPSCSRPGWVWPPPGVAWLVGVTLRRAKPTGCSVQPAQLDLRRPKPKPASCCFRWYNSPAITISPSVRGEGRWHHRA
jgi:hypothetical protein